MKLVPTITEPSPDLLTSPTLPSKLALLTQIFSRIPDIWSIPLYTKITVTPGRNVILNWISEQNFGRRTQLNIMSHLIFPFFKHLEIQFQQETLSKKFHSISTFLVNFHVWTEMSSMLCNLTETENRPQKQENSCWVVLKNIYTISQKKLAFWKNVADIRKFTGA